MCGRVPATPSAPSDRAVIVLLVYACWWMALLPLGVLLVPELANRPFPRLWWGVAGVVAIGWLADTVAFFLPAPWRWVPSLLYPGAQLTLLALLTVRRPVAWRMIGVCALLTLLSFWQVGAHWPEDLVRTMAWGTMAAIALDSPMARAVRDTVLVTFGLGLVVWVWHVVVLSSFTWWVFQAVQALGVVTFSVGAWRVRLPLAPEAS